MSRFVEGADRSQNMLCPERLDDYIGEDNPVRVVGAFVENLDLATLGLSARSRRRQAGPVNRATRALRGTCNYHNWNPFSAPSMLC